MQTISRECASVCLGQMQDVALGNSADIPSEADVLSVYRYKTARYTFSLPLMLGAILAGVPEKEITILEKTGESIGLLFQMQDDMLNLFGTVKETGKPVGSDLREGKKTLAYLYLYNKSTDKERKMFNDPVSVDKLLEKYSVHEYMNQKIEKLITQSHESINSLHLTPEALNDFHDIIEYIGTRTK
jgi:geranylgeranyl pyrophosphate synthase